MLTPSIFAPLAGIARILQVADLHARLDVGRRRAIDDHLGAAEIDVVLGREHGDLRPLEPHLNVARGGRRRLAHAEEHRALAR